jgi:histidinol-phosphate aminotransferase
MTAIDTPPLRLRSDFSAVESYKVVRTLEALAEHYAIPVSEWVKLNQNENPYGAVPEAVEAIKDISLHRYPDSATTVLCEALSSYCDVPPARIIAGNGGDEIIDVLFRLIVDPGDEVITAPPTFGFYPVAAKLNRARLVNVPRDARFRVDVDGIRNAVTNRTRLLLICSPNNPTGNVTLEEDLVALLDLGIPVVLDEAYVEFAGRSALHLQDAYPHLMVIRTFSKCAGLAGLRIGYGVFSELLAPTVEAIRPAYTVNAAAQAAAIASLAQKDELLRRVALIRNSREALATDLARFRFLRVWPSDSNFIYCTELGACSIGFVYEELLKRGVIVRLFANPDAIRITVGTERENARLVTALIEIEEDVSRVTLR